MAYEELTIEGRNAVIEAFRAGKTVDKIFVLEGCKCNPKSSLLPGRGTHTRHRNRHCFGRCSAGRDGRSHPAGRC